MISANFRLRDFVNSIYKYACANNNAMKKKKKVDMTWLTLDSHGPGMYTTLE